MQCFTLATKLQQAGYQVEVIDYTVKTAADFFKKSIIYNRDIVALPGRLVNYNVFKKSPNCLPLSKTMITSNEIDDARKMLDGYDIVLAGSDEIWKLNSLRGFPNAYWLPWIINAKKVSYAASTNRTVFSQVSLGDRTMIANYLQDFKYVGVRDEATRSFIADISPQLQVERNCDPCFLLNPDEDMPIKWEEFKKRRSRLLNRPTIGLMTDDKELGRRIRERFGDRFRLVSLYVKNKYADETLYDLSPFEWVYVFRTFRLMVTSFFHGAVLSIVNKTPVISFDTSPSPLESKLYDLFSYSGLNDCYFSSKDFSPEIWEQLLTHMEYLIQHPCTEMLQSVIEKQQLMYGSFLNQLQLLA